MKTRLESGQPNILLGWRLLSSVNLNARVLAASLPLILGHILVSILLLASLPLIYEHIHVFVLF